MFGIKQAPVHQLYQDSLPLPITHEAGGGVTYIGYCERLGIATSDAKWLIIRITEAGGITLPEYANGKATFTAVWDDRASLNYAR